MQNILWLIWPPICSIIEITLLYYFFHQYPKRFETNNLVFIGYFIIMFTDIVLNSSGVESNPKLAVIVSLLLVMLSVFYKIKPLMIFLAVLAFVTTLILSDMLTFVILSFTSSNLDFGLFQTNIYLQIEGTLISKGIHLILLWLLKRLLFKSGPSLGWSETILSILPVLVNIALIFFLVDVTAIFTTNHDDTAGIVRVVILTILMLISSISIAFFLRGYMKLKEKENKANLMQQQSKEMLLHYHERELAQQNVRKLYHDIKNHLAVLNELPFDERIDYLTNIQEVISDYEKFPSTGSQVLDVIISDKMALMETLGIRFSHNLSLDDTMRLENIDVVTIFGNAIDNAIEACIQIPMGERFIKINSASGRGMLIVKISNPTILKDAKNLKTLKKDRENHGIGLQNIKMSIDKYHGEMVTDIKDEIFSLSILLPQN